MQHIDAKAVYRCPRLSSIFSALLFAMQLLLLLMMMMMLMLMLMMLMMKGW